MNLSALDIRNQKDQLRKESSERRAALHATYSEAGAASLARLAISALPLTNGKYIAGYSSIKSEIETTPLLRALRELNIKVALPVVIGAGLPLVFREWTAGDPLMNGLHGTRHPSRRSNAIEPDLVLIPLLAFDSQGGRLGYGAGYYDRTLHELKQKRAGVLSVGVAYDEQQVEEVPTGTGDSRLDAVITDRRLIVCGNSWPIGQSR